MNFAGLRESFPVHHSVIQHNCPEVDVLSFQARTNGLTVQKSVNIVIVKGPPLQPKVDANMLLNQFDLSVVRNAIEVVEKDGTEVI